MNQLFDIYLSFFSFQIYIFILYKIVNILFTLALFFCIVNTILFLKKLVFTKISLSFEVKS